ncbi:Uncharacterised protein [Bordetella pertussis]|nr:Uncharacterised protein [Bordetella pertussis]
MRAYPQVIGHLGQRRQAVGLVQHAHVGREQVDAARGDAQSGADRRLDADQVGHDARDRPAYMVLLERRQGHFAIDAGAVGQDQRQGLVGAVHIVRGA